MISSPFLNFSLLSFVFSLKPSERTILSMTNWIQPSFKKDPAGAKPVQEPYAMPAYATRAASLRFHLRR
jgi:hypothetical protein